MGSIESAENSEVKAYLQKILHNDPNAKNEWNEEQKTPRVGRNMIDLLIPHVIEDL